MLRTLSLFAGIGGFDLGLERTGGFRTVAFCEIDPFCRRVLAKHWPGVPCYHDVRDLTAERLAADGISVDVICGGFPCQDISVAGAGAGIDGARSGLWSEYARLVGELRPRFVIVENVSALLGRGLGRVLGDLAALRFDAEWHCVPASAVGAPHRRDRLWIIAIDADHDRHGEPVQSVGQRGRRSAADSRSNGALQPVANANGAREPQPARGIGEGGLGVVLGREDVADAEHGGREGRHPEGGRAEAALPHRWWGSEPDVGRVAHGVPARVDRLRSLGNAVVPQIPELIGRAILAATLAEEPAS